MIRFLLCILLILPLENLAQDANALLKEAKLQESQFKESEAFVKYAQVVRLQPSNLTVLCKCSELCTYIGGREKDKLKKADYFKAGKTYATAALRVNPNSSEANVVMAMAIGRLTLIASGKDKIASVNDIKLYADKAIKLDPSNFKAYHVLGKWNYEISNLNFLEKTLAKLFYGDVPKASLTDAIAYYEKARAIDPGYVLNYLELAKAYYRDDQKKKAVDLLTMMMPLPNHVFDDTRIKVEGNRLLKEWK
jgi:tetratricopeptide (TPR) repeat protein